ncbi:hypothetical protein Hanom_Chr04g00377561 [Helianthus anomalus]
MQTQCDTIGRLSGEKAKISEQAEQDRVTHQKREQEYIQCITKLEKFAAEKDAESKASEILAEEAAADCKWLLARVVPLISECIAKSDELAKYMFELGQAAYNSGRKDGYGEGRAAAVNNEKDYHFELYKQDCTVAYTTKRQEYEFIEFGVVKAVEKLSRKANAIEVLKKALGVQGTRGAGPSYCVDPAVFSSGALQFLFYHVYDAFMFRWARSGIWHDRLWLCVFDPTVHFVVSILGDLQCFLCHWWTVGGIRISYALEPTKGVGRLRQQDGGHGVIHQASNVLFDPLHNTCCVYDKDIPKMDGFTDILEFMKRLPIQKALTNQHLANKKINSVVNVNGKEKQIIITEQLVREVINFPDDENSPSKFPERMVKGCLLRMGYNGDINKANYLKAKFSRV